jgi:Holliday junction resolvase RusA-like endonuclease
MQATCKQEVDMKFTVPIAPSGNKMWRHTKRGVVYKTTECREYQQQVSLLAKIAASNNYWKMATGKVFLEYTYYWPDKRKRDTGNQKKVINDALQGIIVDNDCNILERDIDFTVDKHKPRIEITVRKWGEIKDDYF